MFWCILLWVNSRVSTTPKKWYILEVEQFKVILYPPDNFGISPSKWPILIVFEWFKMSPTPEKSGILPAKWWILRAFSNSRVSPTPENFEILQAKWCLLRAFGQFKDVPNSWKFCDFTCKMIHSQSIWEMEILYRATVLTGYTRGWLIVWVTRTRKLPECVANTHRFILFHEQNWVIYILCHDACSNCYIIRNMPTSSCLVTHNLLVQWKSLIHKTR